MTAIDRFTESASRWMARRSTRRSFLGGVGKTAVVVAGGSAVASLFAQQAQARVCGQTGVSPKCPTYDCMQPGFWGYCWYASPGCCANGGLKKICDCCLTGWPNVQGYCPDGSSVYCIVESCLEDPRVQTVPLDRWAGDSPAAVALARSAVRPAGGASTVVIGTSTSALTAALAAPVAAELGAPLLLCPPSTVPAEILAELTRLGTKRIVLAAPGLSSSAKSALDAAGATENLVPTASPDDIAGASVEIAHWLLARGARTQLVAIAADGEAHAIAPAAAAFAAALRAPLLIGPDAVKAAKQNGTFTVTCVGTAMKGAISGAKDVTAGDPEQLALALADLTIGRDSGSLTLGLAPVAAEGFGAVVAANAIVLVHAPGVFSPLLRDWLVERRRRFSRAEVMLQAPGALDNANIYWLQSALNGFDAHQLSGYAGEGLPAYPQPLDERTLGQARVSGQLPATSRPPTPARTSRPEDAFPVRTVVMPPPTSWPPGTTTTTLPPPSESTTRPPRATTKKSKTK